MTKHEIEKIIKELKKASKNSGQPVWAALADDLDKSKRSRIAVNLSRINRLTEDGDTVLVPGKVLASGKIKHAITIAAYDFSDSAKEKILQANGTTKTYNELISESTNLKNIKLIK